MNKFYTFCIFSAIWKDNGAINCITVQHKKGSFPSTLTGHTTLVLFIIIEHRCAGGDITQKTEMNGQLEASHCFTHEEEATVSVW
jgi:hypothetical protein